MSSMIQALMAPLCVIFGNTCARTVANTARSNQSALATNGGAIGGSPAHGAARCEPPWAPRSCGLRARSARRSTTERCRAVSMTQCRRKPLDIRLEPGFDPDCAKLKSHDLPPRAGFSTRKPRQSNRTSLYDTVRLGSRRRAMARPGSTAAPAAAGQRWPRLAS